MQENIVNPPANEKLTVNEELTAQKKTVEDIIALLAELNTNKASVGIALSFGDKYEASLDDKGLTVKHTSAKNVMDNLETQELDISHHTQEALFDTSGEFISGSYDIRQAFERKGQESGPIELNIARKLLNTVYQNLNLDRNKIKIRRVAA